MPKTDPKKQLPSLYRPAQQPHFVEVPPLRYAMIDGRGAPGGDMFQHAIETLFTFSYRVKFLLKKAGTDFVVMPLEGLWWADDMADFMQDRRDNWRWTLMVLQPDFVPTDTLSRARASVAEKLGEPAVAAMRVAELQEGRCAQVLHLGPFATEAPVIADLHATIAAQGGTLSGRHHEIYLSDFRRTAPEKLRTILRQPFEPRC